jgi:quercetin dioxygenase-like cupin family protein
MAGLIRNLTETRWARMPGGIGWRTRPEQDESWEQIGIAVCALEPGEALAMYHREDDQEDFLVLSGEGTLLVEGEERPLRQWDFFHCPPGTGHAILGGPLVVAAVGARPVRGLVFPADEVAQRHGFGVEEETDDPSVAFARFGEPERVPYDGWLE